MLYVILNDPLRMIPLNDPTTFMNPLRDYVVQKQGDYVLILSLLAGGVIQAEYRPQRMTIHLIRWRIGFTKFTGKTRLHGVIKMLICVERFERCNCTVVRYLYHTNHYVKKKKKMKTKLNVVSNKLYFPQQISSTGSFKRQQSSIISTVIISKFTQQFIGFTVQHSSIMM